MEDKVTLPVYLGAIMQNWKISGTKDDVQYLLTDGGDWGKEVVNGVGIDSISNIEMMNEDKHVMFFVRKGVIHIGEQTLKLGINLGGYAYTLFDECLCELEDMAPFKTAMFTYGDTESKVLGKHLMVKYKVTHIIDKVTKNKTELDAPAFREYLIYLDKYGQLVVC